MTWGCADKLLGLAGSEHMMPADASYYDPVR
ncbi:hypothetical protein AF71_00015390 [Rhizobium sp. 57MFTsu3.2]|nr:hypothetical protein [Rhizobium sp. 57MFTsu3.2]